MQQLRWRFAAGAPAWALPPEPASFDFGVWSRHSPFRQRSFVDRWRAIEDGYQTVPADCPPVRALSRYGFVAHCPGHVTLRRLTVEAQERHFAPGRAAFGRSEIVGDAWPGSDSGLVASWILGSEFVKVHTGIDILFPRGVWLFQGPLPNASLSRGQYDPDVMAAVEGPSMSRTIQQDGQAWTISPLTIIVRVPASGDVVTIERGQPLAWLFPVPPAGEWHLMHAPDADRGA